MFSQFKASVFFRFDDETTDYLDPKKMTAKKNRFPKMNDEWLAGISIACRKFLLTPCSWEMFESWCCSVHPFGTFQNIEIVSVSLTSKCLPRPNLRLQHAMSNLWIVLVAGQQWWDWKQPQSHGKSEESHPSTVPAVPILHKQNWRPFKELAFCRGKALSPLLPHFLFHGLLSPITLRDQHQLPTTSYLSLKLT